MHDTMNNSGAGDSCGSCKTCACPHHNVMAWLITAFGLLFLLGSFEVVSSATVSMIWPILVIVGGLFKMGGRKCKCC